jgi:hypothetical protein
MQSETLQSDKKKKQRAQRKAMQVVFRRLEAHDKSESKKAKTMQGLYEDERGLVKHKKAETLGRDQGTSVKSLLLTRPVTELYCPETCKELAKLEPWNVAQLLPADDSIFISGYVRNTHTYRVLMKAAGVSQLIYNATRFCQGALLENGHIECPSFSLDAHPLWRLVNGQAAATEFVCARPDMQLRIVAFELRLDYNLASHRFLLQKPSCSAETHWAWEALLVAEKLSQYTMYQNNYGVELPRLPATWGPVDGVDQMPCALWIRTI